MQDNTVSLSSRHAAVYKPHLAPREFGILAAFTEIEPFALDKVGKGTVNIKLLEVQLIPAQPSETPQVHSRKKCEKMRKNAKSHLLRHDGLRV